MLTNSLDRKYNPWYNTNLTIREVINIRIEVKTTAKRTSRRAGNPSFAFCDIPSDPYTPSYRKIMVLLRKTNPIRKSPKSTQPSLPQRFTRTDHTYPTRKNKPNQTQFCRGVIRTQPDFPAHGYPDFSSPINYRCEKYELRLQIVLWLTIIIVVSLDYVSVE